MPSGNGTNDGFKNLFVPPIGCAIDREVQISADDIEKLNVINLCTECAICVLAETPEEQCIDYIII